MTPAVTHPLVSAWLRDLELLLHGVEPGERAEVLAGVHEHLDASLGADATDDDVRRTLAELGSPQSIADEAYAGRVTSPLLSPRRAAPSLWQAYGACLLNGLMLTALGLLVVLQPHPSEILVLAIMCAIPWAFVIVLTAVTHAWATKEKCVSIGLAPGTVVGIAVALWFATSVLYGPTTYAVTMSVIGVAAVAALVRLVRSAIR